MLLLSCLSNGDRQMSLCCLFVLLCPLALLKQILFAMETLYIPSLPSLSFALYHTRWHFLMCQWWWGGLHMFHPAACLSL